MRFALIGLTAVLAIGKPIASGKAAPPFNLGDIWALRDLAALQISPDGGRIAYVLTGADISTDRRPSHLHLIDVRTRVDLQVSDPVASVSQPTWSVKGELAYVAITPTGSSIVVLSAEGSERIRIAVDSAPRSLVWSRDGQRLAYFASRRVARPDDLPFVPPAGVRWSKPGRVIDSPEFQEASEPFQQPFTVDLYEVSAIAAAHPRRINTEPLARSFPYFGTRISWGRGDGALYLSIDRGDYWRDLFRSKLYMISVANGKIETIGIGEYQYSPVVSPDGKALAYQCMNKGPGTYFRRQICVRDLASGRDRVIAAELDRDVGNLAWDADSRSIVATYADHGLTRVARFSLGATGTPTIVATTMRASSISVSNRGDIAFIDGDDVTPGDVAVLRASKVSRLTAINADLLVGRLLARTSSVTFRAADSVRPVEGFLTLPPRSVGAAPYPTLVLLHGGQSSADGPGFRASTQIFASHGYAVLAINYRGSGSYGSELGNTLVYPKGSELDVLGGVDELIRRGIADPGRLFIGGGSGGGATTGWVTSHSDRFKAAAMWYPPVNWQDGQYEAATGFTTQKHQWGGMPWDKPFDYAALSPITHIDRVSTPTLLVVGDKDRITPMSGSIAYFNALQWRGIPSRLIIVPDEPHGTDRYPSHVLGLLANTIEWFSRYGGPKLVEPVWPGKIAKPQ